MSTQPLVGGPRFQQFDNNGNPLSGGLVYTYAAGTSAPLATYTDSTGSVANANPVVLDSAGRAEIWGLSGTLYKIVVKDSSGNTITTTDNYPFPADQSASTDDVSTEPGGRLGLGSGDQVNTGDVTGATVIYYVPYKHEKVPLYDGVGTWALFSVGTQLSQAVSDATKSPAAMANNSNYDLFIWNDSGTVRLSRGPPWPSDTVRGTGAGTTELTTINGRHVNKNSISNGPAANCGLYVGSVRSNGTATIDDTFTTRYVWNMYNRTCRPMRVTDATATWNYTLATWRQARANSANRVAFLLGLNEDAVTAKVLHHGASAGGSQIATSIGLDGSSAPAPGATVAYGGTTGGAVISLSASYEGFAGVGQHTLSWLEWSNPSSTTTWTGTNDPVLSGLQAEMLG